MKEYIVKIPENEIETVSQILEKFGAEVTPVLKTKTLRPKKINKIKKNKPLDFFGTWKDIDLEPENFRKKLWERNLKF